MEDTLYAAAIAIIVGTAAAHSFIWTWVWLRKRGLVQPAAKGLGELESRMASLERENIALEHEIERIGEAQRFATSSSPRQLDERHPPTAEQR
jgi:hypothetical protein